MWYSDKHKALYIHPIKTAGTSIKHSLSRATHVQWSQTFKSHANYRTLNRVFKMNNLFVFSSVRNPWDWEVSHYHWILQQHLISGDGQANQSYKTVSQYLDFNEYVIKCLNERVLNFNDQTYFLQNGDEEINLNYLIRYENLEKALKECCNNFLSKVEMDNLILANRQGTERNRDYRSYYTEESKKIVAKLRQRDIDNFHYTF